MNKIVTIAFSLICTLVSAQTVSGLITEVNTANLDLMLNEFTGEVPTTVAGNTVTILNRVSSQNTIAADYAKEKFASYGNLSVEAFDYSANGTNIFATQTGMTNPDDIYIICAHYDSVTDYCANDNATGTTAILEIARILSQYCIDNTVIYALFDEEEDGLLGSANYVNQASTMSLNILGVINLDMIGYDANQADDVPIHVQDIANSLALKDDAIAVLSTYSSEIGLTPTVVDPGIELSDHKRFWDNNISAIMVTDPADFSELSPYYHTSGDRVSTLDLPYFYKMTKFLMGIVATKSGLLDNAICMTSIDEKISLEGIEIAPNPASQEFTITLQDLPAKDAKVQIFDLMGRVVHQQNIDQQSTPVVLDDLNGGTYFVKIRNDNKTGLKRIVVLD